MSIPTWAASLTPVDLGCPTQTSESRSGPNVRCWRTPVMATKRSQRTFAHLQQSDVQLVPADIIPST